MPAERFPAIELVPKRETQLLDFLASNEKSDGRGIVIAVLDQGKMFISNFSLQLQSSTRVSTKNLNTPYKNL